MVSGSESFTLLWSDHARHVRLNVGDVSYDDDYIGAYQVAISSDSMNAQVEVILSSGSGGDGMADFFDRLARDFRGWDGTRTWRSLEVQFGIDATWGSGGHVTLRAWAAPSVYDRWEVAASFEVEAGEEMETLAANVRRLFDATH